VHQLKVAWSYETESDRSYEFNPIIVMPSSPPEQVPVMRGDNVSSVILVGSKLAANVTEAVPGAEL
jgi:hypothetical protein